MGSMREKIGMDEVIENIIKNNINYSFHSFFIHFDQLIFNIITDEICFRVSELFYETNA